MRHWGRRQGVCARLLGEQGGRYASALGIDIGGGRAPEVFKWFLAAILYGARISQGTAARTYREFARARLLSPRAILETGWDGLVEILDRGGYVRYDFKTATKLLLVCESLQKDYGGNLNALHAAARDARDLERRVRALGKGIGEVTAGIFLRELRGVWSKADPAASKLALAGARDLGFTSRRLTDRSAAIRRLRGIWRAAPVRGFCFADFEAALVRRGIALRHSHPPAAG
ncbi:MAG TPA: hypothetical protein VIA19_00290 [Burkholderiales bacterium]|jgi:hypothetical protein